MNNAAQRKVWGLGLALALTAGSAMAASWQDQLNSAASQLGQQNTTSTSGTSSGGLSLSTLSGLLNGGDNTVSANTMGNAAGIMQYCVQNNIVNNNVASVKEQVLGKLGLNTETEQAKQTDYQQGLAGLLNTGSGQQLNLKSLGDTQLGQKVKTKACDVVLKQGKNFIS